MAETHVTESFDSERSLTLSGVLVTALVGTVAAYANTDSPAFLWICALASVQVALFLVFLQTSTRSRQILIFCLEALNIAVLLVLVADSFVAILTIVWLVQSVELFGARRTVPLLATSLLYFTATQFMHYGLGNSFDILASSGLYGMLQVFAVSVIQRFVSEREQKEYVASLNRELIATRQLLSQSAAQSERLRIARDLHDILGHHMTALILNLEVTSHSVDGEPKEKVEQSLALAKLLLSDLRSTVGELREGSSIDLQTSIEQLISGIPNFTVDVDFSAASPIENLELAETLLRCTQEAVTNVLRHSNGNHCVITLRDVTDHYLLTVADNGQAGGNISAGNGLTGMEERVKAQGGKLNWQQTSEGFQLSVELGTSTLP